MTKSSKTDHPFMREPRAVRSRRADRAEWTSEGERKGAGAEYARRRRHSDNNGGRMTVRKERVLTTKRGGTAGLFPVPAFICRDRFVFWGVTAK